jgi:hypothetical protein
MRKFVCSLLGVSMLLHGMSVIFVVLYLASNKLLVLGLRLCICDSGCWFPPSDHDPALLNIYPSTYTGMYFASSIYVDDMLITGDD